LLLELIGNLTRVHDVFVPDAYGGDGVGSAFGVGRDPKGLEGRGNVGIFDPLSFVGYAFDIEE